MEAPDDRNKCRQYSLDYLIFRFVTSPSNETLPLCQVCEKTLCNDSTKPSKLKDHLHRMNAYRKKKV